MKAYLHAVDRLAAWLDTTFDAAGNCTIDAHDVRYYYKAPYLLTKVGLPAKAARVAKRVAERFFDADGDLAGPPEFALENRIYAMGWLALGGVATERFDLAERVASRLLERQDPTCAAIVLPDSDAGEDMADVQASGGAGMGLIAAGKTEAARRLADRLATLIDAQPEPRCFYTRFRPDGSVFPHKNNAELRKAYDLDEDEQRPANFAPLLNTLVWVGRATREPGYFRETRRYVDLVYSHARDPAQFGRATKFGWAMLNLYQETGDPDLLQRAQALGEVLLARQGDDGLWTPEPGNQVNAPRHARLSYSADCAMTVCALAGLPD